LKGQYEKEYEERRDRVVKLAKPGDVRITMSLAAAKLADSIVAEEHPHKLIKSLTGMIGKFETQIHKSKGKSSVEWNWRLIDRCKCVHIIMSSKERLDVYIGPNCVYLENTVVRDYLEAIFHSEKSHSIRTAKGLFVIGQCYDSYNYGKRVGLIIKRQKTPSDLPPCKIGGILHTW